MATASSSSCPRRACRPFGCCVRWRCCRDWCSRSWPLLYIQVLPWSFVAIERLTGFVHADFIANFARPGAFSQLEAGFVFHFRERTPDGALRGVFMQDQRDPAHITTYIAEAGKTVDRDGASYLQLSKGVLLRPQSAERFVDGDVRRLHHRSVAVHSCPQFDQEAARALDRGIDGAQRAGSRESGADRPYPAANCSTGWRARFTLSSAALSLSRRSEKRARPGRDAASRSAGRFSRFSAFACSESRPRRSPSAVPSAAIFVWSVPLAACLGALALSFRRLISVRARPVRMRPA